MQGERRQVWNMRIVFYHSLLHLPLRRFTYARGKFRLGNLGQSRLNIKRISTSTQSRSQGN